MWTECWHASCVVGGFERHTTTCTAPRTSSFSLWHISAILCFSSSSFSRIAFLSNACGCGVVWCAYVCARACDVCELCGVWIVWCVSCVVYVYCVCVWWVISMYIRRSKCHKVTKKVSQKLKRGLLPHFTKQRNKGKWRCYYTSSVHICFLVS